MATQVYSSHQQTRQQLDELDQLLQRMLTLPLHTAEPALPDTAAASPESFAPLPPNLPQTHVVPRPANSPPVVQAWRMAAPAPPDEPPMAIAVDAAAETDYSSTQAPYPYSLVFGQPLPAEASPIVAQPPAAEAIVAASPAPAAPRVPAATPVWAIPVPAQEDWTPSLFAWPLIGINRLFDVLSHLLGPLGTMLRQPWGRLLGGLGIIMILGAVAWAVADWYGGG